MIDILMNPIRAKMLQDELGVTELQAYWILGFMAAIALLED